jgi:hypothetical protein
MVTRFKGSDGRTYVRFSTGEVYLPSPLCPLCESKLYPRESKERQEFEAKSSGQCECQPWIRMEGIS